MSLTYMMMSCLSKSLSLRYNPRFNNHILLLSADQNNKDSKDETCNSIRKLKERQKKMEFYVFHSQL